MKFLSKTTKTNNKTTFITLGALGAVAALLLTITALIIPFALIWSINTLFETHILYTFKTWLSCYILIFSTQGILNIRKYKSD